MADHSWLIPGETRVRCSDLPGAAGLVVELVGEGAGVLAKVQFDGDSFLFHCDPNDLSPE